jgi:hypothetical protein
VGQTIVCGGSNDLNSTNVPATCGGASNSYKGGNEGLYTFTPTSTGSYTINIGGQSWTGIFVYAGCPDAGGTCVNSIGSSATTKSLTVAMTAGVTYFIWFDTWPTPNSPCPGTFGIAAAAPPYNPCTIIPTIAACGVSTVSAHSGSGAPWNVTACGFSTPGEEKIYTFTPTFTGVHALQVTAATGGFIDYFWKLASDGCGATGWICIDDLSAPATVNLPSWTAGVPVLILLDPEGTGAYSHTFQINCPVTCPAPVSSGATSITATSALANWTTGGGSGTFLLEYGPSLTFTTPGLGAGAGVNGTIIDPATSPQLISGLANNTGYRYFVRQNCGLDGYSANSAGQTFTTLALPPPNDACANAITIACASTPVTGSTTLSTVDAEYTDCGAGIPGVSGQNGVWYKIIGDNNQYTITTCDASGTGYDSRLTVYSGSCGAFTCVTANDDMSPACATGSFRSRVQFNAPAGTDFYVFVHGFGSPSATGNFILNMTCAPLCLPVPGNDLCSNAAALSVDAAPAAGDNTCSGATVGNPSCESAFATLPDVYYSFVASAGGTNIVTINLVTASDLGYAIYDACGGTQVACVATVTSGAPNTHSGLVAGNPYYIRVNTGEAGTGSFDIQVTQPCQPAGTRTAVADCANDQFFIDVNVTSLGTSTDLDITTDFVGDTEPTSVGLGVTQIGPYPSGTTVVVTLVHDNGGACNLALSSVSFTCPPANDLCADAIAVNCNSITTSTTIGSTTTDAPTGCFDALNTAGGIWYTLQGWDGPMTVDLSGSGFDTKLGVFTGTCGSLTCLDSDDDSGDGLTSLVTWTGSSSTTYTIYVTGFSTNTGALTMTVTCGDNNALCTENGLIMEFQTDGAPNETTWEIRNEAGTVVATSGGPLVAPFGIQTENGCVPDGCYTLRVLDSAGDGMTTGGYILRTQGTNERIIDNRNNFNTGSVSAISGGQGFCLPLSNDKLVFTSCDKLDWINGQYVVASPNPAVSAEWIPSGANSVQDANSGYEFWIFDPNGSYSFRRFRSHNVSDGFGPASATRACHMKLNNWVLASQVPANTLMNVRVRARINGNNGEFGPACRLEINPTLAACPQTNLMDIPGNQFFSCGATRMWGANNYVHARPVSGANRYQFRFRIAAEGFEVIRTATTYFVQLNWTVLPLQDGKTYDVDVRVSKDGGLTWCTSADPWGKVCQLTIDNTPANSGNQNFAAEGMDAELRMFPNPNRGDVLTFSLSAIEEGVNNVSVDIYDLTGKRMSARMIAVTDGQVNTTLDLNGELAAGMYVVNIIAGEMTYTERLVIQP